MKGAEKKLPVSYVSKAYLQTMVLTSRGNDLVRFLYEQCIRNLSIVLEVLDGLRDLEELSPRYEKAARILNYLVLLFEDSNERLMDAQEPVPGEETDPAALKEREKILDAAWQFLDLHRSLLEVLLDFSLDTDREKIWFCLRILLELRENLFPAQV
jgi:hypothetical protein